MGHLAYKILQVFYPSSLDSVFILIDLLALITQMDLRQSVRALFAYMYSC